MTIDKKYVLFDLDGTLTDPKEGICGSVQYALKAFGIEEADLDKLEPFIGPPLKVSFMEFYGLSEEDATHAIQVYHERFDVTGKFENKVYAGIPALLKDMQDYGYHMAVASSKPEYLVKEILEHFKLAQYFEVIVGAEPEGVHGSKPEVITEALNQLFHYGRIRKEQVVMVGDRRFDIEGAKEVGIAAAAVKYGYAPEGELAAAEPDYMAATVEQLRRLFIDEQQLMEVQAEKEKARAAKLLESQKLAKEAEARRNAPKGRPGSFLWKIMFPFLLFYFGGGLFQQVVAYAALFLGNYSKAFYDFMFVAADAEAETVAVSGGGSILIQCLSMVGVIVLLYKMGSGRECVGETQKSAVKYSVREWAVWLATTLGLGVGINAVFAATGLLETVSYKEAADGLYAVTIPAGIILYGIISPIAEELLFRGIILAEMKRVMKPMRAALLSSALFGLYHGNPVQLVYAFVLSMVLSFAYYDSKNFAVPVVLHGAVNVVIFLASMLGLLKSSTVLLVLGILLVAGFGFVLYKLYKSRIEVEESK